eukprot:scaffold706_cov418-Prasinococcus_capsulatus_cf.AAC.61
MWYKARRRVCAGVAAGVGRSSRGRIFGSVGSSAAILPTRRAAGACVSSECWQGKHEIGLVAERLGVRPREELVGAAHRLYKLAVQRNFTRGRRTQQVAGDAIEDRWCVTLT